jgi:hypothetical protein
MDFKFHQSQPTDSYQLMIIIRREGQMVIKAVGLWLNLMTGDAHECHQDIESVDQ